VTAFCKDLFTSGKHNVTVIRSGYVAVEEGVQMTRKCKTMNDIRHGLQFVDKAEAVLSRKKDGNAEFSKVQGQATTAAEVEQDSKIEKVMAEVEAIGRALNATGAEVTTAGLFVEAEANSFLVGHAQAQEWEDLEPFETGRFGIVSLEMAKNRPAKVLLRTKGEAVEGKLKGCKVFAVTFCSGDLPAGSTPADSLKSMAAVWKDDYLDLKTLWPVPTYLSQRATTRAREHLQFDDFDADSPNPTKPCKLPEVYADVKNTLYYL
jgi:hypothetical protein